MDDEGLVPGFTTRRVCEIAGVAPSTLNSWASKKNALVTASIIGADGKRSDRFWSVRDLVIVRTIKALRQAGCPMQQLRKAQVLIDEAWGADLAQVVLFWDGSDLIATDPWGDVQSLIRHPGQHMFQLVAVPLDAWRDDARRRAKEVDVEAILERRAKRAGAKRTLEQTQTLKTSHAPRRRRSG